MDTKTLIIAALVAALGTILSMAVVFWTRLTYQGFGYWLAGIGCRVLAGSLFLLPRDQFPPWLTIVLANYLMLAELMLCLRGTLIFRGQPVRNGWDILGSLSYVALLGYFSYVIPSINARIVVYSLYYAAWDILLIRVLLSRRPTYFGSIDRWQAGVFGVLAAAGFARAWYVWMFAPPLTDYLSGPAFQGTWILLLMLSALLIALSQVMMNAQRLEYDLRMAQGQLEQARRAADLANGAKTEFLAHMSHEIRTPLNVVLGLAQVLDREPLRGNQRDMVGRIQDAGRSVLAIVNDVLDLSKIEAGQLRMEAGPFDPTLLLAHIDSLMGPSARAKGLAFSVAGPVIPPGLLVGDALRLQQVLLNLIGNAIKFTEQGEVALRVAAVESDASAVRLRFAIRDSGIGIAPASVQHLFTPFTQAETGITRRFGGTGLGLSISKHLVELLGGEIGVESAPGEGSIFWFELPFARAAETSVSAGAPDAVPRPSGPRLSGAHLLVVDDSAMNRDLVERVLQLEGASVTPAADGQQALQLLKTSPAAFDAVLMDIRMPVMDGLTATRLIRGELGLTGLPVIALTAGVLPEEQAAAASAGVNDLLAKPLDLEQLVALLLKWVDRGRGLTESFPDIEGIDRTQTALTLGQDRALFLHLLTLFTDEFADAAARTCQDLAAGERETATRRLHTLGGSAGNLGAMALMRSARALEEALAQGAPAADLAPGRAAFERRLGDFLEAIAPWRSAADVATSGGGTKPTAAPVPPHQSAQILIVDDTPANVAVLVRLLEHEYPVSFATSGPQAFDLLAQGARPELILLDVMMPGMDGYAVCAALKADPTTRDIPVIFITAKMDEDSEVQALNGGGVDFIHKPVNGAVVHARVRLQLELQRRTRELEQSLADVARAHEQLKVLWQAIEQSPTSIVITAADAIIQYVNPQFTKESGYTAAEAIGQNPRILQSGLTAPSTFADLWDHLTRGESWKGELINRRKSGDVYWEEAHLAPVKDAVGTITHYVAVKLDITERKQAYERIAYMAHHDVLTNLPNRGLFFEKVAQALELAGRNGNRLALLFIDLDKFKPINDTWGHAVGDLVLQAVAKRMTDRLRAADTVGRIGGDEFVVLLTDVRDEQSAVKVAEGIGEALRQPITLDDKRLSISSSIGMAYYPDHGRDAVELARHADEAMYQAKASGRDRLKVFSTGLLP